MVYFFRRNEQFIRCEVRPRTESVPDEIVITDPEGEETVYRFSSGQAAHVAWLELEAAYRRRGWEGPWTRDARH